MFGSILKSADELDALRNKTVLQIEFTQRAHELDADELDQQVADLLDLEMYKEQQAMTRLKADLISANEEAKRIEQWRDVVVPNQAVWRSSVSKQFDSMGATLDAATMELHTAESEQEWAVQDAMQHLSKELDADIGKLSQGSKAQLARMAQTAGHEIAALLANERLDDKERGERIAKVKETMAERAREILAETQRVELSQAMYERGVTIAAGDLQTAMMRIANLERATTYTAPADRATLDKELREQIRDVKTKFGEDPFSPSTSLVMPSSLTSLAEVGGPREDSGTGSYGRVDRAVAVERDPVAQEARGFIERYTVAQEDTRAVDEDVSWARWLDRAGLGRALP